MGILIFFAAVCISLFAYLLYTLIKINKFVGDIMSKLEAQVQRDISLKSMLYEIKWELKETLMSDEFRKRSNK